MFEKENDLAKDENDDEEEEVHDLVFEEDALAAWVCQCESA